MKLWMKLLLTGATSFAGGFALGYLVQKKTAEVEIEEISEEELEKLTKAAAGKTEETENDIFETPEIQPIPQDEKEAYFKRWKEGKEETPAEAYDTRTKETPDDVVTTEDVDGIEEYLDRLKDIEAGTMADWLRCMQRPDGEYDPIELTWYEADNIVCDDQGEPLEDSEKHMGFDIREQFYMTDDETTGDPDIRVIFNNKTHTIYHITRISGTSYAVMKRMEEYGRDGYDEDERSLL